MLILFSALIFGLVVLFVLLRGMGDKFNMQIHGKVSQKIRAILRLVLLVAVIIYILLFLVVIVKTIFM